MRMRLVTLALVLVAVVSPWAQDPAFEVASVKVAESPGSRLVIGSPRRCLLAW